MKDVHSHILTQRGREVLKRFIESGEKLDSFTTLVRQLEKHKDSLHQDFELIEATLRKANTLEEREDEALRHTEERRKARPRTRGPYRKTHTRS